MQPVGPELVDPGPQRWVCCRRCCQQHTSLVLLLGFHARIATLTILCLMQPCSGTNGARCQLYCQKQKREQNQAIFTTPKHNSPAQFCQVGKDSGTSSYSAQVCSPC